MKGKVIYKDDSFIVNGKEYTIDWFYQQYKLERKSNSYFSNLFNIKTRTVQALAKRYGCERKNSTVEEIGEDYFISNGNKYTKDWLYQQYIVNKISVEDIQKETKISKDKFFKVCNKFNIHRNEEKKIKYYDTYFEINGIKYPVKEIKEYYIDLNNSFEQCIKKFGISNKKFPEIIKHYNLNKTKEQREATRINTNKNRYGKDFPLQVEEFKNKRENSCLERWGDSQPTRSVKYKKQKIEKQGYINGNQKHLNHIEQWLDNELFINYLKENYQDAFATAYYFNVDPSTVHSRATELHVEDLVKNCGGYSKYEEEIIDILTNNFKINKNDIQRHVRHGIFEDKNDHREIDIYLSKNKIGIEFNGNYWHSDTQIKYQDHNGRSRTHQQKSLDAEKQGVFIFQIFEYEWKQLDKRINIINRLKTILGLNENKIYARKCEIVTLSKKEKKEFLDFYHIQGNDRSTIALGLKYGERIVSCMSFLKPKTNYTWELSRFCSIHDTNVIGGASKLFKYFVNNYLQDNEIVVSYNDISKTKGTLYEILGFELKSINPPNYIWMNFKTNEIRTRYQEQAGGENERMHKQDFHKICDCGTKTWVYVKGK